MNARPWLGLSLLLALGVLGCENTATVSSNLPLKRVVVYRNGIAYFERGGKVDEQEVRFKMKENAVGDFLATLAVMEQGGSSQNTQKSTRGTSPETSTRRSTTSLHVPWPPSSARSCRRGRW